VGHRSISKKNIQAFIFMKIFQGGCKVCSSFLSRVIIHFLKHNIFKTYIEIVSLIRIQFNQCLEYTKNTCEAKCLS
jgi:hypothetical protein